MNEQFIRDITSSVAAIQRQSNVKCALHHHHTIGLGLWLFCVRPRIFNVVVVSQEETEAVYMFLKIGLMQVIGFSSK